MRPSQRLILYHGMFAPHRGIEESAEALLAPVLGSAHLALLGFGTMRLELEQLARDPRFQGRLHVIDAVPPGELLEWVAGAEVDIRKWPFQAGLLHAASIMEILKSMKAGGSDFDILKADFASILIKHAGTVRNMLIDGVVGVKLREGGAAPEPQDWIDELSLDEMVPLCKEVLTLNLLPLVKMAGDLKGAADALRALRPQPTS